MVFNVGELLTVGLARTETLLGLALLAFSVGGLIIFPQPELRLIFIITVFLQSICYLTAPAMALLAERDIRSRRVSSSGYVTGNTREFHTRKLLKPGSQHLVEVNKVVWGPWDLPRTAYIPGIELPQNLG